MESAFIGSLCQNCQLQEPPSVPPTDLPRGIGFAPPPWSLGIALGVLVFFMLAMIFIPAIVIGVWAQLSGVALTPEGMDRIMADPQANLVGVASVLLVHVMTALIGWGVVTGWRRRFTDVVGWSWHPRFKLHHAVLTVALLYASSWVLQNFLPSGDTDFEALLKSSLAVRITITLLAVITAPFVEELVYRGILYPAFQVKFGQVVAIVSVAGLFALVHFQQYAGSPLILVSLTLLSFVLTGVRAFTGKLLPCYVIHLLYNLLGSTMILVEYG